MRFKGKDILLLFLYVPGTTGNVGEPVMGTTRLTKAFFLFEEEMKEKFTSDKIEEMPEFIAWNYGPWSKGLIDDIEFFKNINFIRVNSVTSNDVSLAESEEYEKFQEEIEPINDGSDEDIFSQEKYSLTEVGTRYVENRIWPTLSVEQKKLMTDFKSKVNSISLFALLQYVYKKYSKGKNDWTKNSVIKDKIL